MKIALIGAPKTGKTKLGKQIAKDENLTLIDNLPQNLSRRTGIAVGFPSDYRIEIMLAAKRLEEMLVNWENDVLMTTTILDSLAYGRIRQITQEETEVDDFEKAKIYNMVELWYHGMLNTFNFDKVIFLPYKGKNETTKFISGALEDTIKHFEVEVENLQNSESGEDQTTESK